MKVYTKKGDSGTTGLLFGGRARKDSRQIEANGCIDEAQAAIGVARAELGAGHELAAVLVSLERDLWVLMAEVATSQENRHKLEAGTTLVSPAMVEALETLIDRFSERFTMPNEFAVPGQDRPSALLDLSRTVVRRAERAVMGVEQVLPPASYVVPYLNRLSDLLWTLARFLEGEHLLAKE